MRFVDTNVLLYALSQDPAELAKAETARRLLTERDLALSSQVLGEFYVQVTRPSRPDRLSPEDARDFVRALRRFPVQSVTAEVATAAMETSECFRISYWDAAVIEAARALGCEMVLSEDLADGQDYAGVSVSNPFSPAGNAGGPTRP